MKKYWCIVLTLVLCLGVLTGFANVPSVQSEHEHVASSRWRSNDTEHWKVCEEDHEKFNAGVHVYGEWIIDKEPTVTKYGVRHRLCVTCGYTDYEQVAARSEIMDFMDDYAKTYDRATIIKSYVDKFEELDGGKYKYFYNVGSDIYEFLYNHLPLFVCDDKEIEEIYYYRAYAFAKHFRKTSTGQVIVSEYLERMSYDVEGAISCPVGHQLRELRWFKNTEQIGRDYIMFWTEHIDGLLKYNHWFIYAVWEYCDMTGQLDFAYSIVNKLEEYFNRLLENHVAWNGMYKSADHADGMEYTVSFYGIRPTINSYVYADAYGLYKIFSHFNDARGLKYKKMAATLKEQINTNLFKDDFYYTNPLEEGEPLPKEAVPTLGNVENKVYDVKEQVGFIPFYFGIGGEKQFEAWKYLMDENVFLQEYGITTVDQSHPQFNYKVNHACLWNGPVWPFATSQTLTALSNSLKTGGNMPIGKAEYTYLLNQYARSQWIVDDNGVKRPWIDENLDGETGVWLARQWCIDNGVFSVRGRDYNHSTCLDLVLNGFCGVDVKDGAVNFQPQSDGVAFFVEGLKLNGNDYVLNYNGQDFACKKL